MFVDSATLRDLEVVPAPAVRGTTLWDLLNRTRSRVGSEALRKRLLSPPNTTEAIVALQRAHQALAASAEAYRRALDATAADEVDRYLNLTWQLPRDMPPVARARKWYHQFVQDIERGRPVIASLLEGAHDLSSTLATADVKMLGEIAGAIAELMQAWG
jgi:hypothetical protein